MANLTPSASQFALSDRQLALTGRTSWTELNPVPSVVDKEFVNMNNYQRVSITKNGSIVPAGGIYCSTHLQCTDAIGQLKLLTPDEIVITYNVRVMGGATADTPPVKICAADWTAPICALVCLARPHDPIGMICDVDELSPDLVLTVEQVFAEKFCEWEQKVLEANGDLSIAANDYLVERPNWRNTGKPNPKGEGTTSAHAKMVLKAKKDVIECVKEDVSSRFFHLKSYEGRFSRSAVESMTEHQRELLGLTVET